MIPISVAVEDELSRRVASKILVESGRGFHPVFYVARGSGRLSSNIRGYNQAARHRPFLVLTDLDSGDCAPGLVKDWLPVTRHPNLMFRVAVREIESWVLADREALREFLAVSRISIPTDTDAILDPKRFLVQLAGKSASRRIREALVPRPGSTAPIGREYNSRMSDFVDTSWRPKAARSAWRSLRRTMDAIASFNPSPAGKSTSG